MARAALCAPRRRRHRGACLLMVNQCSRVRRKPDRPHTASQAGTNARPRPVHRQISSLVHPPRSRMGVANCQAIRDGNDANGRGAMIHTETTTDVWPALPLADWQDTLDTLHMWLQIIGKI